jgi:hypothetical protein
MLFNSSDLKNANNSIYEYRSTDGLAHWYITRDLGTALGTTGRFAPAKGDPEAFERDPFILGVRDGFVEFDYDGWHQELARGRVTPEEVRWAGELLARLGDRQWRDAFRAGGYSAETTGRFVQTLRRRIEEARRLGAEPPRVSNGEALGPDPGAGPRWGLTPVTPHHRGQAPGGGPREAR